MALRGLIVLSLLLALPAGAEDAAAPAPAPAAPAPEAPAATASSAPAPEASGGEEAPPAVKPTRKVRRGGREKEAEGTQAPNRFQADTVIKSQYKLDGQLLEVDPD